MIYQKPWSIHQFEAYRPHMTGWVRKEVIPILNTNTRRLLIRGQVKVGKREIVEYISLRDYNDSFRHHIFLSSFHRKADEIQRDELEQHGVTLFSIFNKTKAEKAIEFIKDKLFSQENNIVIHWDECDYGTGDQQILASIYKQVRDHKQVFNILYSATPEELLFSNEIIHEDEEFVSDFYEKGLVKEYKPPAGYCGALQFMNNNLVHDATAFFKFPNPHEMVLSAQAKLILHDAKAIMKKTNREIRVLQELLDDAEDMDNVEEVERLKNEIHLKSVKNILILRLTYCKGDDGKKPKSHQKAIYSFLKYSKLVPELKDVAIYADKSDVRSLQSLANVAIQRVQWGKKIWWDNLPKDKLVLIVHDQTSTRSTEWACHNRIFATHDYRKIITYNSIMQAQLRSAHYIQNYNGFQPIRIYGHLKSFQLCIGQISVDDYLTNNWVAKKIPKSNPPRYLLKHINNQMERLPIGLGGKLPLKEGYSFEYVQEMLSAVGCTKNGKIKVSHRVKDKSKRVPVVRSKFYPCKNPENREVVEALVKEIIADEDEELYPNGKFQYTFSSKKLFLREHIDPETGLWMGVLREMRVFDYKELVNSVAGIRINKEKCRLTVCYKDGQVGLCLRVATGDLRSIYDYATYKSMYCI